MQQERYDQLRDKAERLGIKVPGSRLSRELALLSLGQDDSLAELVQLRLEDVEAQLRDCKFLEPDASAGLGKGDVHVLDTVRGQPIGVSFQDGKPIKVDHLALFGQTGKGKSSLQANIAIEAAPQCHTFIIDVNRFFRRIPAMFVNHTFLRWEHLRLNIFDAVPGILVYQHDQTVVSELCRSYGLQFAELEIMRIVGKLRGEGTPNLVSVLGALESSKVFGWSKRRHYLDSALLVISNLLLATDQLFRCERGMPVDKLLSGNIVLELDGLLARHQAFLIRFFFEYLHLSSLAGR